QMAILVNSINQQASAELARGVSEMRNVQRRILLIVPATALSTSFIAAFLGWSIAQRIIELRLDERVNERTRIARELHDTLLQSVQGLILRFDAIARSATSVEQARHAIQDTLDRADQVLAEARDRVRSLRRTPALLNDLPAAFERVAREGTKEG